MSKVILIGVIVILVIVAGVVLWVIYAGPSKSSPGQGLTSNGSPSNFTTQGVKVEIERQGTGSEVISSNVVTVNYVGTLPNGTKFDSSYDRNQAFSFTVGTGQVIKGWDVGIIGMKVGEKRKLTIPPEMAYGVQGFPAAGIPQNATLVFEVELLKISPR